MSTKEKRFLYFLIVVVVTCVTAFLVWLFEVLPVGAINHSVLIAYIICGIYLFANSFFLECQLRENRPLVLKSDARLKKLHYWDNLPRYMTAMRCCIVVTISLAFTAGCVLDSAETEEVVYPWMRAVTLVWVCMWVFFIACAVDNSLANKTYKEEIKEVGWD